MSASLREAVARAAYAESAPVVEWDVMVRDFPSIADLYGRQAGAAIGVVLALLRAEIEALPTDPLPDGYISSRDFKRQVLALVAAHHQEVP